jgi:hypothetical protein
MTSRPDACGPTRWLILAALSLGMACTSQAIADQVVYFVNGKAMLVKSVERGAKFTVLEMDGGSKMGVPNEHIARIEEYEISAPSPVPVAVAPSVEPVLPAAIAAQPQAGVPPAMPLSLGPGIGGVAQGMDRLKPLAVGAEGEDPQRGPAWGRRGRGGMGAAGGGRFQGGAMGPGMNGPGGRGAGRQGMSGRGGRAGGRPEWLGYQQGTGDTARQGAQGTTTGSAAAGSSTTGSNAAGQGTQDNTSGGVNDSGSPEDQPEDSTTPPDGSSPEEN